MDTGIYINSGADSVVTAQGERVVSWKPTK